MKTVIVQGDGIASHPLPELDGQTPLQVANTPNLDELATQGELGGLTISPEGLSLSSAVTHVSLLGYDPRKYCSGLGPFEAASLEVVLEQHDMAFLCHLVTLDACNGQSGHKKLGPHVMLADAEAGGINSEDARELIDIVNEQLGSETIQFYAGERHRHVMVWIGGATRCECYNPSAAQGHSLESYLPSGNGADVIKEVMEASRLLLRRHPINLEREQAGLKPANCLWLWGPGKALELPKWQERWSNPSITIANSGVHRGIARSVGIDVLNPWEHSEEPHEEFGQYAQLCLTALESKDFVYVHVPMPPMNEKVDALAAVRSIEKFDEEVIGVLMQSIVAREDSRLLVVGNQNDEVARGRGAFSTPYAYLECGMNKSTTPIGFDEIQATQGATREVTRFAARLLATKTT